MNAPQHRFAQPTAETPAKKARPAPPNRWGLLLKCLSAPILVLAFYFVAPHWLNGKLHDSFSAAITQRATGTAEERSAQIRRIEAVDFRQLCLAPAAPAGLEKLRAAFDSGGTTAQFERLNWGLRLSVVLVAILGAAIVALFTLSQRAKASRDALITSYRLGWRIAMAAALTKLLLLIPLLTYGCFEFTVILSDRYFPKLIAVIVIGGALALWGSIQALLRKVPMEFKEPMSREVTPEEAPELWSAVRQAAARLYTAPPDHIVIGMQLNFYVTEIALLHDNGRAEGRTLFLSHPLLRHFTEEETLSIIGHELGHFIGDDTRITREFYPMRYKFHATLVALARSGIVAWTSFQFLAFFSWCFAETESTMSRERELLADKKGASLTSAPVVAQALVKFHALVEGFNQGIEAAIKDPTQNPLELPLRSIIREKLVPNDAFWTDLFEQELPHPLDTHPPLGVRLESLGQQVSVEQAKSIATAEGESAYDRWLGQRGQLFQGLVEKTAAVVNKMRQQAQITEADYQTEAGKKLLDEHFPEIKWQVKGSSFWPGTSVLALLTLGAMLGAFLIPIIEFRIVMGLLTLFFGACVMGQWTRHHLGVLALNARGLTYTGWHRPLHFEDVEQITWKKNSSAISLMFRLKEKRSPIWKFSLPGLSAKVVSVSLSGMNAKPIFIAQTILRYYTRQQEAQEEDVDEET